jgi:hypothetical protein
LKIDKVFILSMSRENGNHILNVYTTEDKAKNAIDILIKANCTGATNVRFYYIERELR